MMGSYHPETYWSDVARRIAMRPGHQDVAGDDDPYYRYKRTKFLRRFLDEFPVRGQVVAEIGCGPGGNLIRLAQHHPAVLIGVEIAEPMLALAAQRLDAAGITAALYKTEGRKLPLDDRSVDLAFTVTVLMHNTDPAMFQALVAEICRISRKSVIVVESIGHQADPAPPGSSSIGRRVEAYEAAFKPHGFVLREPAAYLGVRASRRVRDLTHAVYQRIWPTKQGEGDKAPRLVTIALSLGLPVTRCLDAVLPDRSDLAKMEFERSASVRGHAELR